MERLFLEQLIPCIKQFLNRPDTIFDCDNVLQDLVRKWVYDAGVNLDAERAFWPMLDKLAMTLEREVREFTTNLTRIFCAHVEVHAKTMDALVREYEELYNAWWISDPEPGKKQVLSNRVRDRYLGTHYGEFIHSLKDALIVHLPVIALLGGEMSGDMFGIGATLVCKEDLWVLVGQNSKSPLDHAQSLLDFLQLCSKPRAEKVELKSGKSQMDDYLKAAVKKMGDLRTVCWLVGYDVGTRFLNRRELWEDDSTRNKIRRAWGVTNAEGFLGASPALVEWMEAQGLPFRKMKGKKVLVIWSRFTGKKGEIHVEHDTSFHGTRQLVIAGTNRCDFVIIAGDKPIEHNQVSNKPFRAGKFDRIVKNLGEGRAFNLTEFWEDPGSETWRKTRMDQFKLYECLHRWCDVRHLGMRSGNLEAMALLGYYVRYMEESGSWGAERMKHWNDIGLGYERIEISRPPTRTGQYLVQQYRTAPPSGTPATSAPKMLKWLTDRNQGVPKTVQVANPSGETKPEEIQQFEKGFAEQDLARVRLFLQSLNTTKKHEPTVVFD